VISGFGVAYPDQLFAPGPGWEHLEGVSGRRLSDIDLANATVGMMREYIEAAASHLPTAENVGIERVNCGPCGGDLIRPSICDTARLVIFYHGGGFVCCSSRTHRAIASNLARSAGCVVLVPDYRFAPENSAPAAHDDAFAVYRRALQDYAPSKLALSGDSAGGNLALASAVRARQTGLPLPGALALMSPWLDLACEGRSHRDVADDPILSAELLLTCRRAYLGYGDCGSPDVTPFDADFLGLPPTLMHVGSWERLRDDSITVVERMKAAGVPAKLKIFDGMCGNCMRRFWKKAWRLSKSARPLSTTIRREVHVFVRSLVRARACSESNVSSVMSVPRL
jgi:epsilon-lactone hydrolase